MNVTLVFRVLDILLPLLSVLPTPLNSTGQLPSYGPAILEHIILSNGIWRPGRKAAALRNKIVKTLLAMLSTSAEKGFVGIFFPKDLAAIWDAHLLSLPTSVLEDDDMSARGNTLAILDRLLVSLLFDGELIPTDISGYNWQYSKHTLT